MQTSAEELTLKNVKHNLEQWRIDKKGGRIPKEIWQQISMLAQFYNPSLIRSTLRISGSQYRANVSTSEPQSTFLEVPTNISSVIPKQQKIKSIEASAAVIKIHRIDGACLLITAVNNDAISTVISSFLR